MKYMGQYGVVCTFISNSRAARVACKSVGFADGLPISGSRFVADDWTSCSSSMTLLFSPVGSLSSSVWGCARLCAYTGIARNELIYMWICQCSAYFRFIPYTHAHTHTTQHNTTHTHTMPRRQISRHRDNKVALYCTVLYLRTANWRG